MSICNCGRSWRAGEEDDWRLESSSLAREAASAEDEGRSADDMAQLEQAPGRIGRSSWRGKAPGGLQGLGVGLQVSRQLASVVQRPKIEIEAELRISHLEFGFRTSRQRLRLNI